MCLGKGIGFLLGSPWGRRVLQVWQLLSLSIRYRFIREEADIDGRFLLVELEIDDQRYIFCSMYAPKYTMPREEFFLRTSLCTWK